MSRIKIENQAYLLGLATPHDRSDQRYYASLIDELKLKTEASSNRYMPKPGKSPSGQGVVYQETLYKYYVDLINDTLHEIRQKGHKAYVFDLFQIRDVVKYEPLATFRYLKASDSFEVTLQAT
ncbi:MAG: hypothetical protein NC084_06300 [Bacteroides sp.]|nr:hypothetical protein [Eubacterium sp.]MCM1418164.1 hypothetical protein [Roseburia sp.]MCM1462311.1 hypothetical protein [Bacteroides sp.]